MPAVCNVPIFNYLEYDELVYRPFLVEATVIFLNHAIRLLLVAQVILRPYLISYLSKMFMYKKGLGF